MGFAFNSVTVSGNLVRDPETKTLSNGTLVTEFSVAWNERRKQQDGQYADHPHFFDVTMWGNVGASVARQVSKGDPCAFSGRLQQRRWKADDGSNRARVGIVAYDAMPGKRPERQDRGGYGVPPQQRADPGGADMNDGGGWSGGGGGGGAAPSGDGWTQQAPSPEDTDIPFVYRVDLIGQSHNHNPFSA